MIGTAIWVSREIRVREDSEPAISPSGDIVGDRDVGSGCTWAHKAV